MASELRKFKGPGGAESYMAGQISKMIVYQMLGYPVVQIVPDGLVSPGISYKDYFRDIFNRVGLQVPILTISENRALKQALDSPLARQHDWSLLEMIHGGHLASALISQAVQDSVTLARSIKEEFSVQRDFTNPDPNLRRFGNPLWLQMYVSNNRISSEDLQGTSLEQELNSLKPNAWILPLIYKMLYKPTVILWGNDFYQGCSLFEIQSSKWNTVCGSLMRVLLETPNINLDLIEIEEMINQDLL